MACKLRLRNLLKKSLIVITYLIGVLLTVVCLLELLTVSCDKYQPASEQDVSTKTQALRKHNDTFLRSKTCLKNGKNSSLEHLISTNSIEQFDNGIPKLLHSTWKTHVLLNEDWDEVAKECRRLNRNFTFCHWDDADLEAFVASHYPDFLHHFLTYPYPIQKADVSRYLILQIFGGFYKDTNIGCRVSFSSIIHDITKLNHENNKNSFKILFFGVNPAGIAADFIATTPDHPFFYYLLQNLKTRPRRFGIPYLDVLLGTGPLFLGQMYRSFISNNSIPANIKNEIVLIPLHLHKNTFFYFLSGGTWHCLDGRIIWWTYIHIPTIAKFILIIIVLFVICFYSKRYYRFRSSLF